MNKVVISAALTGAITTQKESPSLPITPEEIAADVAAMISEEMEQVASLNVPLIAEAKWGKSWYDAK